MSTPVSAQGSYDMGIAQLRNEIAAKDAEIERLHAERLTLVDREGVWSVRAVKAEQENERLRAALSVSQANLNIAKANLHNERTAMKARRVLEGK